MPAILSFALTKLICLLGSQCAQGGLGASVALAAGLLPEDLVWLVSAARKDRRDKGHYPVIVRGVTSIESLNDSGVGVVICAWKDVWCRGSLRDGSGFRDFHGIVLAPEAILSVQACTSRIHIPSLVSFPGIKDGICGAKIHEGLARVRLARNALQDVLGT